MPNKHDIIKLSMHYAMKGVIDEMTKAGFKEFAQQLAKIPKIPHPEIVFNEIFNWHTIAREMLAVLLRMYKEGKIDHLPE